MKKEECGESKGRGKYDWSSKRRWKREKKKAHDIEEVGRVIGG